MGPNRSAVRFIKLDSNRSRRERRTRGVEEEFLIENRSLKKSHTRSFDHASDRAVSRGGFLYGLL
jgi:hypothetical protein